MKITFVSVADLREYFGRAPVELQLPAGATLRDVLAEVDQRWGAQLPGYLWDREQQSFRGPIFLLLNKKVVRDFGAALCDGQEVVVMHALAGG